MINLFNNKSITSARLCILIISSLSLVSGITKVVNENYRFAWEIVGDHVEIEVTAKTRGYIGFGFSPHGGMQGADFVFVGVGDNVPYLNDMYVRTIDPQNKFPEIVKDAQQDYTLISGRENGTHTTVKFKRLLTTCDNNDFPISMDTSRVIWSFGNDDNTVYHGATNRGTVSASFLDPISDERPDFSKYKNWTYLIEQEMPESDTTYWCNLHKAPVLEGRHQTVAYEILLPTEEALKHTHHLDTYRCTAPDGVDPHELFGPYVNSSGTDCYYSNWPEFPKKYCNFVTFGWAKGGAITQFPEHIGLALRGDEYYMTEIHYDNPEKVKGVKYQTGVRMYYTDKPRENEGSYLLIGTEVNYLHMIPPSSKKYTTVAHCSAECTANFPKDGIKVFNVLLHAHLAGRRIRVRHFRDGVELPWILNDENYDFNFQQNRPLRQEITVLPGDHLSTECIFDSSWNNTFEATLGGRSTREEMCQAFLYYYPKLDSVVHCNSEVPKDKMLRFLGIEEIQFAEGQAGDEDPMVIAPPQYNGMMYSEVIEKKINWTAAKRQEYQNFVLADHENVCFPSSEIKTPTKYPAFIKPYVAPEQCTGSAIKMMTNLSFNFMCVFLCTMILFKDLSAVYF